MAKLKIAICIENFSSTGGMERVLSVCANHFIVQHEVTIITAFQNNAKDAFPLHSKIKRVDLNISRNCKRILPFSNSMVTAYKNKLRDYLCRQSYDIVISMGSLELRFLPSIKDGSRKIVWFHFAMDIANLWYKSESGLLNRCYALLQTRRRIRFAKKFDRIVVLSDADRVSWTKYAQNVVRIYNPLTIIANQTPDYSSKSVISVGRLDYQKGFDYLIEAWKLVNNYYPEWHLNIYGEGSMRDQLTEQIRQNGLEDSVTLKGISHHIQKEYPKHSFYIMSSRKEGFPLVLLEALASGLSIVSYNCPQGPAEIVSHGKNGFLVDKVGDIKGLSNYICKLIEDEELRIRMGNRARLDASMYSTDIIIEQWNQLFESLRKK